MTADRAGVPAPHVTLAVNLKAYLDAPTTRAWCIEVRAAASTSDALAEGLASLVIIPSTPLVAAVVAWFEGTPVLVGAQDVSTHGWGPHTGEVPAALLAQAGCRVVVVGHAERRRAGDDDAIVARKAGQVLDAGLTPLVCVGEPRVSDAEHAGAWALDQARSALDDAPAGRVLLAYEPVWAIGAARAAPATHIGAVCARLAAWLAAAPGRDGSQVLYGGAAGPDELGSIGGPIGGLFLGRSVHDPSVLATMLRTLDRTLTVTWEP